MEEFEADDDVTLLARLIWGEARGERLAGKLAVARTVLNRLPPIGQSRWWGNTVREVMLWPAQYSCFNDEHLRRGLMRGSVLEPLAWRDCVDAARLGSAATSSSRGSSDATSVRNPRGADARAAAGPGGAGGASRGGVRRRVYAAERGGIAADEV